MAVIPLCKAALSSKSRLENKYISRSRSETHLRDTHVLWFERVYSRLGLNLWSGAIVLCVVPFVLALSAVPTLLGSLSEFLDSGILFFTPIVVIWLLYLQVASRHVRRRIEGLAEHAESMSEDAPIPSLEPLYGFGGPAIACVLTASVTTPLFVFFPASYEARLDFLPRVLAQAPWVYWSLFVGTFLWTWSYSMFATYKLGNFPLKVRPFSGDRTLGLKPYASTSLRLTTLYMGFIAMLAIPLMLIGYVSPAFLLLYLSLFSLGLVLFFLPLRTLHAKLVLTKKEELSWVNERYEKVLETVKGSRSERLDERLVGELASLREIQQDIRQIREWPFDMGIVVRLSAIVVSVTAIVISRFILNLLQL